jgi:hypothetical protein
MTIEMESDNQNRTEGSVVPSALDRLVDTGFVGRTARRYGIPDLKDQALVNNVIAASSRVRFEDLPENTFPAGIPGKLIEAATRIETVIQSTKLNSKQAEFAHGLEDNLLGAAYFVSEFPNKVKDYLPGKGHLAVKVASAFLVLQLGLSACSGPKNGSTPVDFTQVSSPMVETYTPTSEPTLLKVTLTPAVTATDEATVTPENANYIPFSEMTDVTDCDKNVIRTDTWADYDSDVQKLLQDAKDTMPTNLDPKNFVFSFSMYIGGAYMTGMFDLQSIDNKSNLPIASCARIEFAGAANPQDYARVITTYIPFPTASGGSEMIPIAFAVEMPAEEKLFAENGMTGIFDKGIADDVVFSALKQGNQHSVVSPYLILGQPDRQEYLSAVQYTVVPDLVHYNEQQYNFSVLFQKVFIKGSHDPATLAQLKDVMSKTLLPAQQFNVSPL